jgi:hypothetical protein
MVYKRFEVEEVEPKQPKQDLQWPVWPGYLEIKEEASSVLEKPYFPAKKAPSGAPLDTASKGQRTRLPATRRQRPEDTFGENSGCRSLLVRCRREAAKAAATEDEASRNVETALAGVAELKRLASRNAAAEKELMEAYAAAGIRTTKRTGNPFTPLVKLVFPKKAQTPATVSRYASVLRFAEEEGIEPNGFAAFVRRNGGLAACATRAAEKRQNSAGGSREAGIAAAEALKARGLNAPKLQLPAGITLPKEGPIALLVEPGPKGLLSLLDYRRVSAGAVASSSPVSARLTKPAEGRRG